MSNDDLVHRADDLEQRVTQAAPAFNEIFSYARRTRHLTRLLFALGTFIVIVGLVIGLITLQVARNSAEIRTNHQIAVTACEEANKVRAGQAELWNFILAAPPSSPRTSRQEAQVASIKALISRLFTQIDCTQL